MTFDVGKARGRSVLLFALAVAFLTLVSPSTRVLAQLEKKSPAIGDSQVVSQTCAKECHQEILGRKHMHGPANTDCGACHVQIGETKDHKFSYIVEKEALCARCHTLPHKDVMHAPVREGKCMECHDPHGSEFRRVLKADPIRDLCPPGCNTPRTYNRTGIGGGSPVTPSNSGPNIPTPPAPSETPAGAGGPGGSK